MAKCGQCERKAMFQVEGDHLLCLHCWIAWQRALREGMAEKARVINYLTEQMEMTAGLPGLLPRLQVPEPAPSIYTGAMTFNNIRVSDSVVGVINTGQVQQLDVALDVIRDAGQPNLAEALRNLSQAVVDARDLDPAQKDEAIEHLTFLAEQAVLPQDQRQRSVGRTVLRALERLLNAAASVMTLWQQAQPLLGTLFR